MGNNRLGSGELFPTDTPIPAERMIGREEEVAAVARSLVSNGRIDPEQAWFWTREWQQRESEADEDLAAGRSRATRTTSSS